MSRSRKTASDVRFGKAARLERVLTLRVTAEQDDVLEAIREKMGVEKAEVIRTALDFWVNDGPGSRYRK